MVPYVPFLGPSPAGCCRAWMDVPLLNVRHSMAKPNFQFEKRQRELEKKKKKEQKQQRKAEKKTPSGVAIDGEVPAESTD